MTWKEKINDALADYPTDDELNEDPEFNIAFALGQPAPLQDGAAKIRDISTEMSKWVLTSIQAVNAGGALAVTQLSLPSWAVIWAGGAFVVGLLLPLLAAHIAVMNSLSHQFEFGKMIGYWQSVSITGFRTRDTELEHAQIPAKAMRTARLPIALAWLATLAFVVGAVLIGTGYAEQHPARDIPVGGL